MLNAAAITSGLQANGYSRQHASAIANAVFSDTGNADLAADFSDAGLDEARSIMSNLRAGADPREAIRAARGGKAVSPPSVTRTVTQVTASPAITRVVVAPGAYGATGPSPAQAVGATTVFASASPPPSKGGGKKPKGYWLERAREAVAEADRKEKLKKDKEKEKDKDKAGSGFPVWVWIVIVSALFFMFKGRNKAEQLT